MSIPVLSASVHDVRYFATLLRGVNFTNRATVSITETGLTVTVEEARSLKATAYIFSPLFDEFIYTSESPPRSRPSSPHSDSDSDKDNEEKDQAVFEIPLNTLIECLNIFGTAGSPTSAPNSNGKYKKWRRAEDEPDDAADNQPGGPRRIDQYFSGAGSTGMRMSYVGTGYPLTLLLAEDASGPTTTCEITTFDPEPQVELLINPNQVLLKLILKSSWLRDALSEQDPSCEKLTFIANPGAAATGKTNSTKPMLRITAAGSFGSTEMDYPNDKEVLESFECTQTVKFTYRFSQISRALRALQTSSKTSLRIDPDGLLSLQFLMPSPSAKGGGGGGRGDAFIEFRCLAIDDDL